MFWNEIVLFAVLVLLVGFLWEIKGWSMFTFDLVVVALTTYWLICLTFI